MMKVHLKFIQEYPREETENEELAAVKRSTEVPLTRLYQISSQIQSQVLIAEKSSEESVQASLADFPRSIQSQV